MSELTMFAYKRTTLFARLRSSPKRVAHDGCSFQAPTRVQRTMERLLARELRRRRWVATAPVKVYLEVWMTGHPIIVGHVRCVGTSQ